jgi:ankyrin repeat protein
MRHACFVAFLLSAILAAGCLGQPSTRFGALAGPARDGDLASLQRLIAKGANPNAADPGGNHWTPLMHAIHKRQPAAVDLLLRSGADATLAVNGVQPLLMAVGTGDATMVRRLLAAGADPKSDDTIFLTAVSGGALSDLDNPLLGRCNTDVVRALLTRAPDLRLPRDKRGRIALMFAKFNHCDAVVGIASTGAGG